MGTATATQSRFLALAIAWLLAGSPAALADSKPKGGPEEFKHLQYRSIGPAAGGRVSRACGVPGDPLTWYMATASGGVWKSSDGGFVWKPIFDDQPISSIGSIAVAPSDPNIVLIGSGEANIRGNVAAGNGIYRSTDAGKTWQHVWKQEGQIGTLIIHPANADIAYAAVLGHAFGPNPERGVYRTTDAGKSWQRVLFKDADTGASDVCFDPSNPRVLFAGLWQARRRPWEMTSGGPGGGLYVSRDGGDSWKQLCGQGVAKDDLHGLPEGICGKVCVAVAPSDGRRIYAMIEAAEGGFFRSDDGGDTWTRINGNRYLRIRPWYFSTVHVDPANPDVVWCASLRLLRSIDGGKSFQQVKGPHHVDHHDLWIDPKNPKRMIDSNDGGVDITINGGETWYAPMLPISQFYHINVDRQVPYHVSGNMQDLGTAAGPSNSLSSAGIQLGDWYPVGGGETGCTVHDPNDPNVVYAGEYGGYLSRYDHRTRQARNVSIYPINPSGHGAEDLRYRFQWTAPVLLSPHDPKTIYHAANVLFRSTDAGQSWQAISPDLTRNDRSKQKWSGGPITGDNTSAEYYCTLFAIAESPCQKGVLWAGSDDGLVHVSQDAGKTWTNVTKNIPHLPEWGTVRCIEPSRFDAGTAYLVVDAHRLDNMKPYLWKTTDFGKSWKSLTEKLPPDVYLHVVREDPTRKGLLFLGTERGVAFSTDDGASWKQLKLNLPTVAVHDLRVNDDLVVGTNGRSIWILDDLSPLRSYGPGVLEDPVYLFTPRAAIRWRYHSPVYSTGDRPDRHPGANPPAGAIIHYHLKTKPKEPITLEVLDKDGKLVRKLSSKEEPPELPADHPESSESGDRKPALTTEVGVNRVVWDLHHAGAQLIPGAKTDGGDPKTGPLAVPGRYTLKLMVDGKTGTTILDVLLDPRWRGERGRVGLPRGTPKEKYIVLDPRPEITSEIMDDQLQFALRIRDDIDRLSGIVKQIRAIRKQIVDRNELLKGDARAETLVKSSREGLGKLDELEAKLHNPKAEVSYDILAQKGGARLYSQLAALLEWVKDSDGTPTQGMRAVHKEQAEELRRLEAEFKAFLAGDLAKLNGLAKQLDLPTIVIPQPAASLRMP